MTGDTVGLRNDGGKKHCHREERRDVAISVRSPGVAMTAPASGFGPGQRRRVKETLRNIPVRVGTPGFPRQGASCNG